jgi:hypothetical protein
MIHIPFFLSLILLIFLWLWFASHWNFIIMPDGDRGTPKELLLSLIGLFMGVLQFTIIVWIYQPIYGT